MRKITQNKKALAEIITVILIILLSLAAIGIIWTVIKPIIFKTTSQINLACTTGMDLQIVAASCNPASDMWTVKLSRGAGDITIKNIKFVFSTGDESKTVVWSRLTKDYNNETSGMIGELEEKIYRFNRRTSGLLNGTNKISVAPVVEGEGGSEIACNVLDSADCLAE
jgi:hypothetical protein